MRKSDREITDFNQIISVIRKCDVCRLALHDEEYPYILPLNFGLQVTGNQITLFFHGATEGKKHELITRNNKAGFEMDCEHRLVAIDGRCTMEYESVIGNGIIEVIEEKDKYETMCILMKHYREEGMEFDKDILKFVTLFKLTVKNITAKARKVQ